MRIKKSDSAERKETKRPKPRIYDFTIIIYSVGCLATLNLLDEYRTVMCEKSP